jgi:hypothetical protein
MALVAVLKCVFRFRGSRSRVTKVNDAYVKRYMAVVGRRAEEVEEIMLQNMREMCLWGR